jgi:signal recognition particle subunit SEC65
MIGKTGTGKSFRGCLNYLFEGRLQQTKAMQLQEMEKKQAEVIAYNQCFGDKRQLIRDFIEVSKLNPNVSKPVFHLAISFAHGDADKLNPQDKVDMAEKLAGEFKFQHNQYVVIEHSDREHQHIHVVANRIGYDGKTASDSNSYKRMAEYCRKMELEYKLTKVLSPNKFLKPEQRVSQEKRLDNRKETLKQHLFQAIKQCKDVPTVKKYMEKQGYTVELGRGIAFTDAQHVRFKGSQVGYALLDIEKKLKQEQLLRQQQEQKQQAQIRLQQEELKQQQQKENEQQVHQYTPSMFRR